jgi:hypothetical protein
MSEARTKLTAAFAGYLGALSISDDDLCRACQHLDYAPGMLSRCSIGWPGLFDLDNYCKECPKFMKTDEECDQTEQGPLISALVVACEKLVSTISATGGLIRLESGCVRPVGDPEWEDLADAAECADAALERYYAAGNPPVLGEHEQPRLQIMERNE